jgi:hypothetical protein
LRSAWKSTGEETGRVLFFFILPLARAGCWRKFASMNERELMEICQRHGWEILGPSPL